MSRRGGGWRDEEYDWRLLKYIFCITSVWFFYNILVTISSKTPLSIKTLQQGGTFFLKGDYKTGREKKIKRL